MNTLNNTRTSMFLDELAKDKSKIAEINPSVVFRNILGLSDKLNTDTVYRALQAASMTVKKQSDMQKKLVDPAYVGEVISFDIGRDPSWCQFKVLRQPIGNAPGQTAINFIVSVTDNSNGKRYDRLVGAIQLETVQNHKTPVFRTISSVITELEIAAPSNPDNEVPLDDKDPPVDPDEEQQNETQEEQPEAAPAVEAVEAGANIIFPKDATIEFLPDPENERGATLKMGDTEWKMESDEFPIMHDVMVKVYKTTEDISSKMLEEEGFGVFAHLNLIKEKPWPPKPDLNEVIIPAGKRIYLSHPDGEDHKHVVSDHASAAVLAVREYENVILCPGVYTVNVDITHGMLDDPEKFYGALTLWEDPEEVVISANEVVDLEEHPGKKFQAIQDIKRGELQNAEDKTVFFKVVEMFEGEWKTPEEIETIKENKRKEEEEKAMNEKIVYSKDEVFTLPGVEGKWRAKCDITVAMTREANGDITKYVEQVVEPAPTVKVAAAPASQEAIADLDGGQPQGDAPGATVEPPKENPPEAEAPVGDIPQTKALNSEHSAADYLKMLFKTSSPNIMHVLNVVAEENANEPMYKLIGTYPVETLSVWPDLGYTFSIIRMKNGSFYRIFVSRVDKALVAEGNLVGMSWFSTRDTKEWFMIGNVTDRDISSLNNRRRV